ncbi:MAG: hypothetical protein ACJ8J7_09720 [Sulfurifustaceae bacterium]
MGLLRDLLSTSGRLFFSFQRIGAYAFCGKRVPSVRGSSDDPYLLPGRPTIPLIVEISHPQEARIVIDELPEAVLKQTTVYVFERNTNYPDEYFDPSKSVELREAKVVRRILEQPESKLDLAQAELTIDCLIDPSIDVVTSLHRIDSMVAQIRAMAGPNASSTTTMLAIKRYPVGCRERFAFLCITVASSVLWLRELSKVIVGAES